MTSSLMRILKGGHIGLVLMVITVKAYNMLDSILLEGNLGIRLIRNSLHLRQGIRMRFFIAIIVILTAFTMKE